MKAALLAMLKPAAPELKKVDLPGGDHVLIRRIGMDEKDRWEASLEDSKGKRTMQDWRAKFLVLTICDENGRRIFDDNDWPLLKGIDNARGSMIFQESWLWNGCDKEELEELKKSSAPEESNGFASSSASSSAFSTPTT